MAGTRYLLWDFDGTLAHRPLRWSGAVLEVMRDAGVDRGATVADVRPFLQSGFPWHAPHVVRVAGQHPDDWWLELRPVFARAIAQLSGVDDDVAWRLSERVRTLYIDAATWSLYDDSKATLQEFRDRGWTQILLSNHVPELRVIIDGLGLSGYFTKIYNSAETGIEKPHPHAFRRALETIPAGASVWMVGDSLKADVDGAEAVGIPAVLVRRSGDLQAKRCCRSLADLFSLVALEQ